MNNRRNQGGGGQRPTAGKKPPGREGSPGSGHVRSRSGGLDVNTRRERASRGEAGRRAESRFSKDETRSSGASGRFSPRPDRFSTAHDRSQRGGRFSSREKEAPPKPVNNIKIVSDLQITDGNHRGKYLLESPSPKGKVMNRHLRETMFRILLKRLKGRRFVDLCAGIGMMGIEAVSRGALIGSMVERRARMCSLVKKNLEKCEIKEGHGELFEMEAVPFLKQMGKKRRKWDILLFRPDYAENYDEVLAHLKQGTSVERGGAVVVGHHAEMAFPDSIGVLKRWRVVTEGDDALSFYERK